MRNSSSASVAVFVICLMDPKQLAAQTSAAPRGCPAPPTTLVAALPEGLTTLSGIVSEIPIIAPRDGWERGRISWVAADRNGLIYILQRGEKADPVVVI